MLDQTVKRAAGLASVGLKTLLGGRAGGRLGILVYHRIAPRTPGVDAPSINVAPQQFRTQLTGLLRRGYRPLALEEVLRRHGAGVPSRSFVVTFDDGHATLFNRAWPVLRELGIPATVFLNTAFLDGADPFPFDPWGRVNRGRTPGENYRPLTTRQCREMARDGLVRIGAHTHTHADFRGQPEALRADLQTCVEVVRSRFGVGEVPFAFPFGRRALGYVSDELVAAARAAHVTCALTTEASLVDPRSDPFGWGRFNAYDWDTGATLAARLEGWYGWAPRLQERLAGVLGRAR